jgi:predicted ribosome quality control (RQC) complex YloA/Tae2 family protein
MGPQKMTVLDVARICRELEKYENIRIDSSYSGYSRRILYLGLHDSGRILTYSVGAKSSYIAAVDRLPADIEKSLPGIEGYRIIDINQINNDRILALDLEKQDRLGKKLTAFLILELMPNIGDAYFVDADFNIKSTLRKKREKIYKYPEPLKKPTVMTATKEQLKMIVGNDRNLLNEIYGLSKRDILNLSPDKGCDIEELYHDLKEYVIEAVKPGPAWIVARDDVYVGYSLVKPRLLSGDKAIECDSALAMYESYYMQVAGSMDEKNRIENIRKMIKTEISKKRKKISRIKKELEESQKADLYRMYGEMILTKVGKIEKGADSVELDPLYDEAGDKIMIKLDPSKSAAANAEAFFKKSRKASASRKTLQNRRQEAERELTELENIAASLPEKPEQAEQKLSEMGIAFTGKSGTSARKPVEHRKPYRIFHASCGWEILIGKSNKDNDELTFHIASKEDYWFHAWQAAGSHAVLKLPEKSSNPDKQTLLEAASLAAYYSKAKHSSKVSVIYTQVKYVRKPRKFPPGKVLVEREKQLMVSPADPDDFLAAKKLQR